MCEYCKNIINENDYTGWKNGFIVKKKNGKFDLRIFTGCDNAVIENIKFCPMCGRNLTEENQIEMKPVIHAHAIIDWLGNCKCSNCGNIDLNSTEPYCQHCGAALDEPEERED